METKVPFMENLTKRKDTFSERRKRTSGGNAIMEGTFVLVPLFALILACFNFGFAIYRWTTLQNAVREGCRYAITFQAPSGSQDTDIKLKVQQFSMGMLDASLTGPAQQ